jgi:hypothetical protein
MNVQMFKLVAITVLFSSNSMAQIYNHGGHNDPLWEQKNINETFSCGSLALPNCISGILRMTTQSCRDLVLDDTDQTANSVPLTYYFAVTSTGARVTKAIGSPTGPFDYVIDVHYGCRGFKHPAPEPTPVTGASFLCVVGTNC